MPLSQDGKVTTVQGIEIRLYPIATLATKLSEALGSERTTQTIRKWETKGVTPPAFFKIAGKRMNSMEQIKCICKVAKQANIRQGDSESLTRFTRGLEKELRKVNRNFIERAKAGQAPQERKNENGKNKNTTTSNECG